MLPLGEADRDACVALAAGVEQASEHPLGRALREAAAGLSVPVASASLSVPGVGIEAQLGGRVLRVGRPGYVGELHGRPLPGAAADFALSDETVVALGDALRPEAAAMVAGLRAEGREIVLLSGDSVRVAQRVAEALGIVTVAAEVSPQGKHDYVLALQAAGAVVAMVGDGVNDAPVLARAQVSIAMGGGSQLARTQADLVLLSDHLTALHAGYCLARRSLTIIRQNLGWAFVYNLVALPLAMLGWVSPWLAGIGMSGSSLLVVLNSLRLQQSEPHEKPWKSSIS